MRLASLAAVYARAAIPARYAVERDRWHEAAALAYPPPSAPPYIDAMISFARAVGAARTGDPLSAVKDGVRFAASADALKAAHNDYWAAEVEAQQRAAAAWIAFAVGKRDEALGLIAPPPIARTRARRAEFRPAVLCRRESFWATCCSKAAASMKRSPLTKRR
jgi:hypothetical protein